jgi:hypothetical protein
VVVGTPSQTKLLKHGSKIQLYAWITWGSIGISSNFRANRNAKEGMDRLDCLHENSWSEVIKYWWRFGTLYSWRYAEAKLSTVRQVLPTRWQPTKTQLNSNCRALQAIADKRPAYRLCLSQQNKLYHTSFSLDFLITHNFLYTTKNVS